VAQRAVGGPAIRDGKLPLALVSFWRFGRAAIAQGLTENFCEKIGVEGRLFAAEVFPTLQSGPLLDDFESPILVLTAIDGLVGLVGKILGQDERAASPANG
jgi:hypothetical protein